MTLPNALRSPASLQSGDSAGAKQSQPQRLGLIVVALCVFGVGFGIVLHNLTTGHALFALTEYDDGVYLGATMHLIAGQLPYRDFVFVQPPGITILLAPIGLIVGQSDPRLVLGVARILTGVTVGLDALLIVFVLRHRGLFAAFTGGMLFAVYPPGYSSDRTVMLEPFLVFFCLLSVALAFRDGRVASKRRLLCAGIALGFAGAIKLFAGAIALGYAFIYSARHRRALQRVVIGAAFGFLVPCVPFLIAAPHAFLHDVFSSQLNRSSTLVVPLWKRVSILVGLQNIATPTNLKVSPSAPSLLIGGSLLALIVAGGIAVPAVRRRATTLTWFIYTSAILAFVMVLVPNEFYTHYDELAASFFCLLIGDVVGSSITAARASRFAHNRTGLVRTFRWVGLGIIAVGFGSIITIETTYQASRIALFRDPARALDRVIPPRSCVVSDVTSLLIIANRLDLSPSCPEIVDATGTWLAYSPKNPPLRSRRESKDPQLVALWQRAFSRAQYVVFSNSGAFRIPFTPSLTQWFNDHFSRVPHTTTLTFTQRPRPISHAPLMPKMAP